MKCTRCSGNGKYETIFGNTIICDLCHGTGEIAYGDDDRIEPIGNKKPMTNEEWLRQRTTEQLAEWILDVSDVGVSDECFDCGKSDNGDCPFGKAQVICPCINKDSVLEWLKQPHEQKG